MGKFGTEADVLGMVVWTVQFQTDNIGAKDSVTGWNRRPITLFTENKFDDESQYIYKISYQCG